MARAETFSGRRSRAVLASWPMPRARLSTPSVELDKNLAPAVRHACRRLCQEAVAAFRQTSASLMTQMDGLRRAQGYLADLRAIVEQSAAAKGCCPPSMPTLARFTWGRIRRRPARHSAEITPRGFT